MIRAQIHRRVAVLHRVDVYEMGMPMSGQASLMPDAVVDALMRATRALGAVTARSLAQANEEVTLTQFRTLVVLSTQGPQTVTALAENLDVHASTMTRMCTRLVARELVLRVPSQVDRREVVITLSSAGDALVEQVMRNRRERFEAIVDRLTEGEQHSVVSVLETFVKAADDDIIAAEAQPAPPTTVMSEEQT
jgi:DNA-binding MarR family transcriptional regulator